MKQGIRKRGVYLALLGLAIIIFAILFLQEKTVLTKDYSGSLKIPAHSQSFIDINIYRNGNLTYTITYNESKLGLNVSLYLSSQDNPSVPLVRMRNPYNGTLSNIQQPGEYVLIIRNDANKSVAASYIVKVNYIHYREKYGALTSITGIILILMGSLFFYIDWVSYYSKKYPDHIRRGPIECHSVKLHRHICTLDVGTTSMDRLIDTIGSFMENNNYKLRKQLIQGLIYERSGNNPFSKVKPAIVTVEFFQYPKITFTYVVPRSRAAGSMDLAWIYDEISRLAQSLGLEVGVTDNRNGHGKK